MNKESKDIRLCCEILQQLICYDCYIKELLFFNTCNILEKNVTATGEIIQNDIYSEVQETNKDHFIIASLNTLSMNYIFDNF